LVHLMPREVLPERGLGHRPFWEQCYFQIPGQVLYREITDPLTGELRALNKWAGHNIGKSILRTDVDAVPVYAHSWEGCSGNGEARSLVTEKLGFHYHFVFMGASLWREKYRKLAWEPDTWITGGTVPFPKQAWKEAASLQSEREAQRYYEESIAIDPSELERLTRAGIITRDTRLRDALRKLTSEGPVPHSRG
jgi:hypothetical protein